MKLNVNVLCADSTAVARVTLSLTILALAEVKSVTKKAPVTYIILPENDKCGCNG